MSRKGLSLWLTILLLLYSFIVIDITMDVTPKAKADIWYVDDIPGGSPSEDFTSVQAAVDFAQSGDTVYVYNGTYQENVNIDKTINLTGESRNNTIIDGNGNGDVIYVTADWVNITGFTVIGSGLSIEYAGIELNNVQNCGVFNNRASSNRHGIYLDSSDRNNITSNNISSNSEYGIYFKYSNWNNIIYNDISNNKEGIEIAYISNNNSIIGNNISMNTMYGIYLSFSGWSILKNNSMAEDGIYILGDEIWHWNTHEIDTSNTINKRPVYFWKNRTGGVIPLGASQVILANCTNVSVENQEICNGSVGIELGFSSYNSIIGNKIQYNDRTGIRIWLSDWNRIKGNLIDSNGFEGVYGTKSKNNLFKNNTITSNGEEGIELQNECLNNVFFKNKINNNLVGVYVVKSNGNEIINNDFINNKYGIELLSLSYYNNISGNLLFSSWLGISLASSHGNLISENTIKNSSYYGIKVFSPSYSNKIFHNYFFDNINQASDDTNNGNYWDDGYPSGGNYWSDYSGIDLNSTSAQDVPPPDGIGDTPYIIDLDSRDNYPLMKSDEWMVSSLPPPTLYINISQDGKDVVLYWDPPPDQEFDPYLIYRSTDPTNFNFSFPWVNTLTDKELGELEPIPERTMWNDTNAAFPGNKTNYKEQYYYIIRAFNNRGEVSGTSRTVGKWTKMFPDGVSTFSLPLEPINDLYLDDLTALMNADYIKYINTTTHTWNQYNLGDSNKNNTQTKLGEGYEVKFSNQTNFTFIGLPGTMVSYDNDTGFQGFNSSSEAKNLTVIIDSNGNVTLNWQGPKSMDPGGWYEVYYSYKRDGFFETFNVGYFLACAYVNFGNNTATHVGSHAYDPGSRLYYMIIPFNSSGVRGSSTYSIGIWTEEYLAQYDTFGIPLRLKNNQTADWYCDNVPDTVGINYYDVSVQRWCWHSTKMSEGAYDPILEMTEGYQISTLNVTKFTFIGV